MNINSAQGFDDKKPKEYKMYEIARMCDANYGSVFKAVRVLSLISNSTEKHKKYTEYQADLIFEYLYFTGRADCLILPSKLNGVEFYGQYN
jgi:hypothetical protein